MSYNRVNWKDYPDLGTPINSINLNKMDNGIYDISQKISNEIEPNIYKLFPTVLYDQDNSATGTIDLSEPATNYKILELFFRTVNYYRFSSRAITGEGRTICISCSEYYNNNVVIRSSSAKMQGNSLIFGNIKRIIISSNNTISSDTSTDINLYYVLGYKAE